MITRRYPQILRRSAIIAAIVLLLGQAIAAAHFHRVAAQPEFSSTTTSAIADASCAICAAQLHSPIVAAVALALDAPKLVLEPLASAVPIEPLSAYIGPCFGRAPPASL